MGTSGGFRPETGPSGLIEAERAFWLAQGMARVAGLRLARAAGAGLLSRRALADMVGRCQTCAFATECQHWLAVPRTGAPPDFCAIRPDILALMDRQGSTDAI